MLSTKFQTNRTAKFAVIDLAGVSQPDQVAPAAAVARAAAPAPAASVADGASESKVEEEPTWITSDLSPQERYEIARSVGEECIQEAELLALLEKKANPVVYDGFEPSGRVHIAQGLMRVMNVNKLTSVGCVFKFWVADWFALLNNKMGGDLKKIQTVGRYMIEVWKAAGMDMRNVQFLWASEEINANSDAYWRRVMDISRRFNVARIQRCCTVMGRKDGDELSSAQMMYPCMQAADIFHLKADICQLGMDQRKVNMLAREYCDEAKPKIKFKPVILSHHMLLGLKEGQEKASKSDPDSAIFMEDSEAEVKRKVKRAFCPPGQLTANPVIDYLKHIVLPWEGRIEINRSEQNGGDVVFTTYEELAEAYESGSLHPGDAKAALSAALNRLIQPVRTHFSSGEPKKLFDQVRKFKVTR